VRRIACSFLVLVLLAATGAEARLPSDETAAPGSSISACAHTESLLWLPEDRRPPASLAGTLKQMASVRLTRAPALRVPALPAALRHSAVAARPLRRWRCPPPRSAAKESDLPD
jgi:hypothetical protein